MGTEIAKSSPEAVSPTGQDKKKHNGRSHDREFKMAAVKLVTEQKYTPKQAALSLGIPMSTLQYWIKVFGQRPQQQAQTMETLRLRVKQLEAENQRLWIEREILTRLSQNEGWVLGNPCDCGPSRPEVSTTAAVSAGVPGGFARPGRGS